MTSNNMLCSWCVVLNEGNDGKCCLYLYEHELVNETTMMRFKRNLDPIYFQTGKWNQLGLQSGY